MVLKMIQRFTKPFDDDYEIITQKHVSDETRVISKMKEMIEKLEEYRVLNYYLVLDLENNPKRFFQDPLMSYGIHYIVITGNTKISGLTTRDKVEAVAPIMNIGIESTNLRTYYSNIVDAIIPEWDVAEKACDLLDAIYNENLISVKINGNEFGLDDFKNEGYQTRKYLVNKNDVEKRRRVV